MISWLISVGRRFSRGSAVGMGCRAFSDFNMFRIPAVAEKGSHAGAVPLDFWPLRRYTGHSQPIEALQGELDGILACPFPFSLMPVCLPEPVLQMGSCRKKGIPAVKNRNALVRKVREVFICLRECRKRLFPQRKRCCRPENWCR